MPVHRMTLVSFRLFHKNLGNLREFFGQMVRRLPWQKIARTPMLIRYSFECTVVFISDQIFLLSLQNGAVVGHNIMSFQGKTIYLQP